MNNIRKNIQQLINAKGDSYEDYESWKETASNMKSSTVICTNAGIGFTQIGNLLRLLNTFENTNIILANKDLIHNCSRVFLKEFFNKMNLVASANSCKIYLNLTIDEDGTIHGTGFTLKDIMYMISNYGTISILNEKADILTKTEVVEWSKPIYDIHTLNEFLNFYDNFERKSDKAVLFINQEVKLTSRYMQDDLSAADFSSVVAQFCNFRKFNRVFSVNSIEQNYTNERIVSLAGKKNTEVFNLTEINKNNLSIVRSWKVEFDA